MTDEWSGFTRIRQRGSIQLDLPPAEAIKLFTAAGERLWVPGWSPHILGPLPQQPGLVFLTGTGPDYTIWTVIESDPIGGRMCYSRVTPGSRAGTVTVEVAGTSGSSSVEVAYDLTALSPSGEASLLAYSPSNFGRMLEDWHRLISTMLADAQPDLASLLA